MSTKNHNRPLLNSQNPWTNNSNSIWLGSTLSLTRNLEKFNFPGKLTDDKRKQIVSLLGKELLSCEVLKHPKMIKAEEMPPLHKEFLVEHFLSTQSFHQAHVGEAFVLDHSGAFLATINLRDHLILQLIDCKEELESSWEQLYKIEIHLNKNVNFAFNSRFGFLTSDPTQCGTGFIVSVFLHLPALIHSNRLDEAVRKYKEDSIEMTSLQGDPEEMIGNIVVFRNNYTLGVTEETILSSLRTLTTKILVEEKSARAHMKHENDSDSKDRISRAFAILLHSYQIEAIEAFNAISLLKLGVDLDWVAQTSHAILNGLLFNSRRAHLLSQYGTISQEELPHKRAEFIHQALKGITLQI